MNRRDTGLLILSCVALYLLMVYADKLPLAGYIPAIPWGALGIALLFERK